MADYRPNLVIDRGDGRYTAVIALALLEGVVRDAALYAEREVVRALNQRFHQHEVNVHSSFLFPGCIDRRRQYPAWLSSGEPPKESPAASQVVARSAPLCQRTEVLFQHFYHEFFVQRYQRKRRKRWLVNLEVTMEEIRASKVQSELEAVYRGHALSLWAASISRGDLGAPITHEYFDKLIAARLRALGDAPTKIWETIIAGHQLYAPDPGTSISYGRKIVQWVISSEGLERMPPVPELVSTWKQISVKAIQMFRPPSREKSQSRLNQPITPQQPEKGNDKPQGQSPQR